MSRSTRPREIAAHQDTIYSGRFTNISVTADGATMAVDDGSYSFSVVPRR